MENENSISNFLISSMFLAMPLILIGIVLYVLYFRRCMQMKQAVTAYGAEQIQSHLLYATIKVCNASITKEVATFFTEQFIYQKNKCVIDYNMIDVMFREELISSKGGYKGITLLLLDGKEVRTCYDVKDEDIAGYMQIAVDRNPQIILAKSQHGIDYQAHAKRVRDYKEGRIVIQQMHLELLTENRGQDEITNENSRNEERVGRAVSAPIVKTPPEWTKSGSKISRGEHYIREGVTCAIVTVVSFLTLLIYAFIGFIYPEKSAFPEIEAKIIVFTGCLLAIILNGVVAAVLYLHGNDVKKKAEMELAELDQSQ